MPNHFKRSNNLMSKYLGREKILGADDLASEDVAVPEWGGVVRVRCMTGAERDRFEESIVDQRGKKTRVDMGNIRAKLVAATVVDEEGARIFSDRDVEALGKKSAAALNRVFEVAQRLSGITDDDVEELAKNSVGGPSDGSISA
jgi:hypothetical protein